MRVATEHRNVILHNVPQESQSEFTISMGPEMFDILSGMYKDIKLAIVRETMTNALDGHARLLRRNPLAAKYPIEIHLPTRLEPWFGVKDYGSSMTHDEVSRIFRTYGLSTKGDNNDEVGGFGIGSKAPFAYTEADQWTLECRLNGERRVYSMYRNERGIPSMALMGTTKTDEPSGVTVMIPIPEYDFFNIQQKVAFLLPFFPHEVRITGNPNFIWKKPEYRMRGSGWGIVKGSHENYVIMGNVPYKVDHRWIAQHGKLPADLFHGHSLHLTVPIGSVLIAPNREMLKDVQVTFDGIEAACKVFRKEFREKVEQEIQSAETLWKALNLLNDGFGIAALRKELEGLKWRGFDLSLTHGVEFDVAKLQDEAFDLTLHVCDNAGRSTKFTVGNRPVGGGRIIPGDDKVFVLLNDMPDEQERVFKKLRYNMARKCGAPLDENEGIKQGRRSRWSPSYANMYGIAYLFTSEYLTAEALTDLLQGVPVQMVSQWEDPPKKVRSQSTRTKTQVKRLVVGSGNYNTSGSWAEVEAIEEDGGLYVGLQGRNEILDFQGDEDSLARMYNVAVKAGILPEGTVLYGIPRTHKRLEKKPVWKPFVPFIRSEAIKLVRANTFEVHEFGTWEGLLGDVWAQFLATQIPDKVATLPPRHVAHKIVAGFNTMHEKRHRIEALRNMAISMRLEWPEPKKKITEVGSTLLREFRKRYPMIVVIQEVVEKNRYTRLSTSILADHKEAIFDHLKSA